MLRLTLGRLLGAAACGCVCALAEPGCASDPPERTARSSSAITQGSADTGDGAVVALVAASGVTACTGTLVAPHMVLTAGHCTLAQVVEGASVVFGSSLNDPVATLPVTQAVTHPQFDPTTLANDVGILILASDAPVAPVPLGTGAPDVGATLDLVGWGLTAADAGDTGQKRQGTSAVTQVDATTFAVAAIPSQPCEGDSGGPALVTANGVTSIVGVTSHGDAACSQGATYTRVDAFVASFIQPEMEAFADAGPYGAACTSDTDCLEGECTTTGVCALRCDPASPTCPSGSTCTNTAAIDYFCIASPPPAKGGGCAVGAGGGSAAFGGDRRGGCAAPAQGAPRALAWARAWGVDTGVRVDVLPTAVAVRGAHGLWRKGRRPGRALPPLAHGAVLEHLAVPALHFVVRVHAGPGRDDAEVLVRREAKGGTVGPLDGDRLVLAELHVPRALAAPVRSALALHGLDGRRASRQRRRGDEQDPRQEKSGHNTYVAHDVVSP